MKRPTSNKRSVLITIILILIFFANPVLAQPSAGERNRGESGVMSVEELQREPIEFELDIPYAGTDNPRQQLDIYLPEKPNAEKLPAIVFIHGGAWLRGNKDDGAARLMPFVTSGDYAGISIGYRFSEEAIFPAQIHDVKAAIRWIKANADTYGIDSERIAVWGRSAGGHLALMLGVTGDVPELEGNVGSHRNISSKVSGVVNFFGVTEILAMLGASSSFNRYLPDAPEALLLGGSVLENTQKARIASPIYYISPNDPPILTIHGTGDRTVPYDQAVRLHEMLDKLKVPNYFISVVNGGHEQLPDEASDRVRDFFAKILLEKDIAVSTEALYVETE